MQVKFPNITAKRRTRRDRGMAGQNLAAVPSSADAKWLVSRPRIRMNVLLNGR